MLPVTDIRLIQQLVKIVDRNPAGELPQQRVKLDSGGGAVANVSVGAVKTTLQLLQLVIIPR
jgi:hypothetical protein